MKFLILRAWAVWRRLRRGARISQLDLQYDAQVRRLISRANPFAAWHERANWMVDVAAWLRHEQRVTLVEQSAGRRVRQQRARFLLDWLDAHRDERKLVQATLQKTLREAVGPELFSATGMPREPAFFSELAARLGRSLLPNGLAGRDLSSLFTAMFPEPRDAEWLLALPPRTVTRFWKLAADDALAHNYRRQIDEALLYLVTNVLAVGISPAFRQRLDSTVPMLASPFMSLRRELESYLSLPGPDEAALRSVRMLVAVCQAQTDRITVHAEKHGVSVSLVYHIERMRSQLARMSCLIELRATAASHGQPAADRVRGLLADLVQTHHRHASLRGLMAQNFTLFARRMVGRRELPGKRDSARDSRSYAGLLDAGAIGGVFLAIAVMVRTSLPSEHLPFFFEGFASAMNYGLTFLLIASVGGVFAGWQSCAAATGLVARMSALDTVDGLRALQDEIARVLRGHTAAVLGNLGVVAALVALAAVSTRLFSGAPLLDFGRAHGTIEGLSAVGATPLYAIATGFLLWLAGVTGSLANNWFALHGMREALGHHRRIVMALGVVRAGRFAAWLQRSVGALASGLTLALLLGMVPVLASFFGIPLGIRHVALAGGTLAAAAGSIGVGALSMPEFWLAVAGVMLTGVLNISVAFVCSLVFGMHARAVPRRTRRLVWRALVRRLARSPGWFLFPAKAQALPPAVVDVEDVDKVHRPPARRRAGGDR
ncbi:MAG: preprotein translocase subunit TatB [Herminiimonas sp.]|nr:preprotein translocase subunit TatB [Herminiimonas sp.]